ncbi:MAG: hypothetical protein ACT4OY_00045 [Alphaproteobacteria bacterium]
MPDISLVKIHENDKFVGLVMQDRFIWDQGRTRELEETVPVAIFKDNSNPPLFSAYSYEELKQTKIDELKKNKPDQAWLKQLDIALDQVGPIANGKVQDLSLQHLEDPSDFKNPNKTGKFDWDKDYPKYKEENPEYNISTDRYEMVLRDKDGYKVKLTQDQILEHIHDLEKDPSKIKETNFFRDKLKDLHDSDRQKREEPRPLGTGPEADNKERQKILKTIEDGSLETKGTKVGLTEDGLKLENLPFHKKGIQPQP